jgi:type II secretory pathway predicted ATPase ExeA
MNMNVAKKRLHQIRLFSEMTDAERLSHLGGFQADTEEFLVAKQALLRLYRGWQTTKDAHILVLTGDSGVGKTTVADDVFQELENEWQGTVTDGDNRVHEPTGPLPPTAGIVKEGPTGMIRPVVKVFVEPKARARAVLRDTLRALGVRSGVHDTFGELMERVELHVVQQRVRLLIFDEVHHVVEGHGTTTAYEAVEVLKMLLIQARVQIVCIGLPVTETILDKNLELPRHCRGRIKMSPLAPDIKSPKGSYMRFLKALSSELPFDRVPNLTNPGLALRLHLATGGFIGHIINLVHAACELAIELGHDEIDCKLLGEVYQNISGITPVENPFSMDTLNEEAIAVVRKGHERRRRSAEDARRAELSARGKATKTKPDFKKR